jgi:L-amino acid N-acyltransferase YncA
MAANSMHKSLLHRLPANSPNSYRRAPLLGLKTLLRFIFGHNEASLHLFESFGFQHWGVFPRVAELDGVERDLIILGRHIVD